MALRAGTSQSLLAVSRKKRANPPGGASHGAALEAEALGRSTKPAGSIRTSGVFITGKRSSIGETQVGHKVFPWIQVPLGQDFTELSPQDIVEKHGVPEAVISSHIKAEIHAEQAVLSLPSAVVSVFLFAAMFLDHEMFTEKHSVLGSISFDIRENANFAFTQNFGAKNFEDVNSIADFWSWMSKGFMPLTHQHTVASSEDSSLDLGSQTWRESLTYLNGHVRVGPVKLSQELVEEASCVNEVAAKTYGLTCAKSVNLAMHSQPTIFMIGQSSFDGDTSKTVFINGFTEASKQKLKDLEQGRWLTPRASRVQVSLLTYHADSNQLVRTNVNFMFSRSGHIWKGISQRVLPLSLYPGWQTYFWDLLFYALVTYIFVTELKEVIIDVCRDGVVEGFKGYVSIWNFIDWIFIIFGYTLLALWLVRVVKTRHVQVELLALPSPPSGDCSPECSASYSSFFDLAESLGFYVAAGRLVVGIFPLVVLCRLFKAFAFQPRLAMVTITLGKAMPNLLHYLIVLLTVFGTYCVLGVALFGRDVNGYVTLDRSFPSFFRMLTGNFDFEEAESVGRVFAFLTFLSFVMLMSMVMLSMLIAIIMDVYCEVKSSSVKNDPVWLEVAQLIKRFVSIHFGQRIPLAKMVDAFDPHSATPLSIENTMDRVPGLQKEQATLLLCECAREWGALHAPAPSPNEIGVLLEKASFALQEVPEVLYRGSRPSGQGRSTWSAQELAALEMDELLRSVAARVKGGQVAMVEGTEDAVQELLEEAQSINHCALFSCVV